MCEGQKEATFLQVKVVTIPHSKIEDMFGYFDVTFQTKPLILLVLSYDFGMHIFCLAPHRDRLALSDGDA